MNNFKINYTISIILVALSISCNDFLEKYPLDKVSAELFWQTEKHAQMWVNDLYSISAGSVRGLQGIHITTSDAYSDDAYGRATDAVNNIANGSFDPSDSRVMDAWRYDHIRKCHDFFENVNNVPEMSQQKYDELAGQIHFFLAYEYYKLVTRFRDVPLIDKSISIQESDIPKSSKDIVLNYIFEQLNLAINLLPLSWPDSENGRITKGAALFLKTRVLLYNERWEEASATAKQVMDLNLYKLHPNFGELFLKAFDNKKAETILEIQYVENVKTHNASLRFAPVMYNAHSLILPTPQLIDAFWMKDGLPIEESSLYNPACPFDNRDPRFYHTFMWHGEILNDTYSPIDLTGTERNYSFTYIYFRKHVVDFRNRVRTMDNNWNLFRYADLLLMYAEAKNESSGPDNSIYEALDLIRDRAGMPHVDRNKYNNKELLRELIRRERRIELAGEGLRYDDIIRWKIAENVLNINLTSMDLTKWEDGPVDDKGNPILVVRPCETRYFNPNKHYVWPIPQSAIDQAENLLQHDEWKN
jgi:hypothetical protein